MPPGADLSGRCSRLGQADGLFGSDREIGLLARGTQRRVHKLRTASMDSASQMHVAALKSWLGQN
jgi:hypothetical protein